MTSHPRLLALGLVLGGALLSACEDEGPQGTGLAVRRLLVIAADPLLEAAEAYGDFRAAEGVEVEVAAVGAVPGEGSLADRIAARVRAFAAAAPADRRLFVLIVGDANVDAPDDPSFVPFAEGVAGTLGDAPYADLDADGIPDLAVGRLPFREATAVDAYRERVAAEEAGYAPGPWNKTVSAFAGEGGFGEQIDAALEYYATRIFEEIPYDFDVTMAYASPTSAYFLPPDLWDADYAAKYNAGAALQPYIGHTLGEIPTEDFVDPPRRGLLAYLSCSDAELQHASPAVGSLGEEVMLLPSGPLGVIAATTISHPYGNALVARELSAAIFGERVATYGEAFARAKWQMVHRIDDLREELDGIAVGFVDEPLADIVATHLVMYVLLGDPLVAPRLPPARVLFDDPGVLAGGTSVTVTGGVTTGPFGCQAMADGTITVTLETVRGFIHQEIAEIDPDDPDPATCRENHAKANDKVVARVEGVVTDGRFSVSLAVPAGLPKVGYWLKGFAESTAEDGAGSAAAHVVP